VICFFLLLLFFFLQNVSTSLKQDGRQKQDGGQLDPDSCFCHIIRIDGPIFNIFAPE